MSGHSKWSTIKRQKGAADQKRGQTFTKIANAITIAARVGSSGDPESNPKLRMALEQAREANMPKDNVARAIDRGLGKLPGQVLEEVTFEGFGPGRVAYLLEGVTDNKLRTLHEIRNLFERSGASLGGLGSTAYLFEKKGELRITGKGSNKEEEIFELIDLGVDEVEDFEDNGVIKYLIYTDISNLSEMNTKITQLGYILESSGVVYKPTTLTKVIDKETAKKVLDFSQKLEEHDDIQKVYANFDIDENLM